MYCIFSLWKKTTTTKKKLTIQIKEKITEPKLYQFCVKWRNVEKQKKKKRKETSRKLHLYKPVTHINQSRETPREAKPNVNMTNHSNDKLKGVDISDMYLLSIDYSLVSLFFGFFPLQNGTLSCEFMKLLTCTIVGLTFILNISYSFSFRTWCGYGNIELLVN